MKTAILNVTGYAGAELARLLHNHPEIELTSVTGRSAQGQKLGEVFPPPLRYRPGHRSRAQWGRDVFSALPHKSSGERVVPLVEDRSRVVDLSADFRLRSPAEYEDWYKTPHASAALQEEAVYGLTELYRSEIGTARLVANPGCFPTSAILALAPLIKEKLVQPVIIIDSKSGVSGAGRGLSLNTHFSEVNENVKAYGIDGHRHLPEIVQEVSLLDPSLDAQITFLPHLIPMTRGILSSCYATLSDSSISVDEKAGAVNKPVSRILRGRAFCQGSGCATSDQADLGQQLLPGIPNPRPSDGASDGGQLHRQLGQRRRRSGYPEHERDGRLSRGDGTRVPCPVPLGGSQFPKLYGDLPAQGMERFPNSVG